MFKTLLLCVDINDEPGAARCADAAVAMAAPDAGVLHVLNVVPDTGMAIVGASLGPDHAERMIAQARQDLDAWALRTIPESVAHQCHVTRGTVYDQILKTAASLGADAIVVGANRPELRDYLIGPNAARVARHATQSVFVIR
ncbi:MAG: universal stress protein [Rhodobacteraceae bacterium]|nr:universal stress protein [Paracoccaceae bacterium]